MSYEIYSNILKSQHLNVCVFKMLSMHWIHCKAVMFLLAFSVCTCNRIIEQRGDIKLLNYKKIIELQLIKLLNIQFTTYDIYICIS